MIHFLPALIPDNWALRLESDGASIHPFLKASATGGTFACATLCADLATLLPSSARFMTGTGTKDIPSRVFPANLAPPIQAGSYLLFRLADDDFLLVAIASWNVFTCELSYSQKTITATFFGDGKPFAPNEELPLETLFVTRGSSVRGVLDAYADAVATALHVHLNLRTWIGWGSWDYYTDRFTDQNLRENMLRVKALCPKSNLVQIDDGYCTWGDWLDIKPEVFPKGLASFVEEASDNGMETGIWFAPFLADLKSRTVAEHPEWLLRMPDGRPFLHFNYPVAILDFSQDEVVEYIRRSVRSFRAAGITYLKADFLSSGALPCRSRNPMTPYERIHRCLSAIREEAGPDTYILGCTATFGTVVGHVDGNRVGPDIGPTWDRVVRSARYCMSSAPFHRKWYQCDSDYLVLRGSGMDDAERTKPAKLGTLTRNEATVWKDFLSMTTNAFLSSDKLALLPPIRLDMVSDALTNAANPTRFHVVDYWRGGMDGMPAILQKDNRLAVFNWTDQAQTYTLPDGSSRTLEPRSSIIVPYFRWDGKEIPGLGDTLELPDLRGEPFADANSAHPLPLGPKAQDMLLLDHETGEGVLHGAYAPLLGDQTLLGVPFHLENRVLTIRFSGDETAAAIPVNRKARVLYLLHAADVVVHGDWSSLLVRTADGQVLTYPMQMGRDIGNTDFHYSLPWTSKTARIAWTEPNQSRTAYLMRLELPAETEVVSLEVTRPPQKGTHILLAVSTL